MYKFLENWDAHWCIGYVCFLVGISYESIGKVSSRVNEPYPWYLPLMVFIILFVGMATAYRWGQQNGYEQGKKDNNEQRKKK